MIKMKLTQITVALGLSLILAACGTEDKKANSLPASSGVYGTWGGMPPIVVTDGGDTFKLSFQLRLEPDRITNSVLCQFDDGEELGAAVSAAGLITSSTIEGLEDKEHVARSGARTCTAKVNKKVANYQLNGNQLTLLADGQVLTLKRQ